MTLNIGLALRERLRRRMSRLLVATLASLQCTQGFYWSVGDSTVRRSWRGVNDGPGSVSVWSSETSVALAESVVIAANEGPSAVVARVREVTTRALEAEAALQRTEVALASMQEERDLFLAERESELAALAEAAAEVEASRGRLDGLSSEVEAATLRCEAAEEVASKARAEADAARKRAEDASAERAAAENRLAEATRLLAANAAKAEAASAALCEAEGRLAETRRRSAEAQLALASRDEELKQAQNLAESDIERWRDQAQSAERRSAERQAATATVVSTLWASSAASASRLRDEVRRAADLAESAHVQAEAARLAVIKAEADALEARRANEVALVDAKLKIEDAKRRAKEAAEDASTLEAELSDEASLLRRLRVKVRQRVGAAASRIFRDASSRTREA